MPLPRDTAPKPCMAPENTSPDTDPSTSTGLNLDDMPLDNSQAEAEPPINTCKFYFTNFEEDLNL